MFDDLIFRFTVRHTGYPKRDFPLLINLIITNVKTLEAKLGFQITACMK